MMSAQNVVMTVFFVAPGALLVLLAAYGLFGAAPARGFRFHRGARPSPA